MVRVLGHTTNWAIQNNLESGESTIFATAGAEIDYAAGELIIPFGSKVEVSCALLSHFQAVPM